MLRPHLRSPPRVDFELDLGRRTTRPHVLCGWRARCRPRCSAAREGTRTGASPLHSRALGPVSRRGQASSQLVVLRVVATAVVKRDLRWQARGRPWSRRSATDSCTISTGSTSPSWRSSMKPVDTLTRRLVVSVPSSTWTSKWPGSISVTRCRSLRGRPRIGMEDQDHGRPSPRPPIGPSNLACTRAASCRASRLSTSTPSRQGEHDRLVERRLVDSLGGLGPGASSVRERNVSRPVRQLLLMRI